MSPTGDIFTTQFQGRRSGSQFVHFPPSGDLNNSTISEINIEHDSNVYHLEVHYSWNNGAVISHGTHYSSSSKFKITLLPDEFISSIEGRANGDWIKQLTFVTTKKRWGPYGSTGGEPFEWGSTTPGARLLAFNGTTCENFLRGLQATFGVNPVKFPKSILYEPLSTETTLAGDPSCPEIDCTIPPAKFRSHLMNPIITLSVGQEKDQYHVHQDTLCKLPFFQAALQGGFKEATEKAIDMPEDDPNSVAALIEFLYTGNYTYTYNPSQVQIPEGSTIPAADLTEGLYRIGVYVVASKYDCQALTEIALNDFAAVAVEVDNHDALLLWKAAYSDGLRLSQCKQSFAKYNSGEGLVSWAKWLFSEYGNKMDAIFTEYPLLAADLLREATGSE